MNPFIVAIACLIVALGATGYRIHVLEQQVGAMVPVCNTEKLQADNDAQAIALEGARSANDVLQDEIAKAQAVAEAARADQNKADESRAALALRLSNLNHAQEKLLTCDAWLRAPVPCDIGM